jgi:hypothetical protein
MPLWRPIAPAFDANKLSENSLCDAPAGAIKKGKAQFGILQVLDGETGALRMVAHQGFQF